MDKIKSFFSIKRNIILVAVCFLVVAAVIVAAFLFSKKPLPPPIDATPTDVHPTSSEMTSSETESKPVVVVPEIPVTSSSSAPASSVPTVEIKVDGEPASKPSTSTSTEKPKDTASKPNTDKPTSSTTEPPAPKPENPSTATPADGDTKLENGSWYTYWAADGQWHYDAPENGGEIVDDSQTESICPVCGGIANRNENTCTCPPVGNMG